MVFFHWSWDSIVTYSVLIPHHRPWSVRIGSLLPYYRKSGCSIYFHMINLLHHLFCYWTILEMEELRLLSPRVHLGKSESDSFSHWWKLVKDSLLSRREHCHVRMHVLLRRARPDLILLLPFPHRNPLQSTAWGSHMSLGVNDRWYIYLFLLSSGFNGTALPYC